VLALLEGEAEHLVPALAPSVARQERAAGPASRAGSRGGGVGTTAPDQLALFAAPPHEVVERLQRLDVNTLTPLAALQLVAELAERART
jgi:hypothetical protein